MKKKHLLFTLILVSMQILNAQDENLFFNFQSLAGYVSSGSVPFWFRSNQSGSIPMNGASLSLISSIQRDYEKAQFMDWGGALNCRLNIGQSADFKLIEGFGKLRVSVFEINAGRSRQITGLCDSSLSSGSFSISGNSPGIPKIQISIPEFYSIPLFDKIFAFKGSFGHGWLGKADIRNQDGNILKLSTYFHQKSLYGRFGKPFWKAKFYAGINHQVFWGNEKDLYVNDFSLSALSTFYYVVIGKTYGTATIPRSKVGNHLGSYDLGFEYEFNNIRLLAYRQNFYDFGAVFNPANFRDGLTGLSLIRKQNSGKVFRWGKLTFEILCTKNLAGIRGESEIQDYYNNYQYTEGWSYNGFGLGTPFISQKSLTREGLPSEGNYFINNRVLAFHFGSEGSISSLNYIIKVSYSKNYGTFKTSEVYKTFKETDQLSTFLEVEKELKNGMNVGCLAGFDAGNLYDNSLGFLIRLSKTIYK